MAEEEKMNNAMGIQVHAAETMEFMQYIMRPFKELERSMNDRFAKMDEMLDDIMKKFPPMMADMEQMRKEKSSLEAALNRHNSMILGLQNKVNGIEDLHKAKDDHVKHIEDIYKQMEEIPRNRMAIKAVENEQQSMMKQQAKMMECMDNDKKACDNHQVSLKEKMASMQSKLQKDLSVIMQKFQEHEEEFKSHCVKGDENVKNLQESDRSLRQTMEQYHTQNRQEIEKNNKEMKLFSQVNKSALDSFLEDYNKDKKGFQQELDQFALLPKEVDLMDRRIESTFQLCKEIRVHLKI